MRNHRPAFCVLLTGLFCVCGCVPLYYHSYDEGYPGLRQRLDEAAQTNAVMHVIVVHGIGNHSPGYSTPLAEGMARLLKLAKQTDAPAAPLVSSRGVTNWLREFSYGSQGRRMVFHEVTWLPTTMGLKTNAFLKDQTLNAHRVLINKDLKTSLMDEALPDAVLYLNPSFRSAMQDPILQTIKRVAGLAGSNDAIVLMASSLGSKMVFDTAVEYETNAQVRHFTERTTDIIMLANQLPLLNLGMETNVAADPLGSPETGAKRFLRMARTHKQNRIDKDAMAGHSRKTVIHVVAATDPDDLLSYPLTERDVMPEDVNGGGVTITVGNIYSHNTGAILFVFANPEAAHDNYDQNEWLLRSLVFGYPSRNH